MQLSPEEEDILFLEIVYFFILGEQQNCDGRGGGGAQRPVGSGNEPKKTGARSTRARTRGQNPLVLHRVVIISENLFDS